MSEVIVCVFFTVMVGLAALGMSSAQCHAKWEGSGMKSEWSVFGGCRVQRKDGTWLPASAVRDLNP